MHLFNYGRKTRIINQYIIVNLLLRSPNKAGDSPVKEGAGRVIYELNGLQLIIPLYAADVDPKAVPKVSRSWSYLYTK